MIYTFYSFNGGVDRSMALANVAQCFYSKGLKVVVVDWDLESPGLEKFFFEPAGSDTADSSGHAPRLDVVTVQSRLGLVDMMVDYRHSFATLPPSEKKTPEPPPSGEFSSVETGSELSGNANSENAPPDALERAEAYLVPIEARELESVSHQGGSLSLLPAGRRSKGHLLAYAQAVRDLEGDEFYASHRGKAFFGWLRRQWMQEADVILILAPAGAGEVVGVCTRQLADVVVSFGAPNDETLDGMADTVERLRSADTLDVREGRPLQTIVVPPRGDRSEPEDPAAIEAWRAADWTLASRLALLAPEDHPIRRQLARSQQETTQPASPDSVIVPPPDPSVERDEELKAALLDVGRFHYVSAKTPAKDEAIPLSASADAAEPATSGEHDRIADPIGRPPKPAPPTRSKTVEPSVPPVAWPGPKGSGRRRPVGWGWSAATLSLLVLCDVYFARRGSRDTRTAPAATPAAAPSLTAEKPSATALSPSTTGSAQSPTQEQANPALVDTGGTKPLVSGAHPQDPSAPPGIYLRVGLGPSCPRMLNYRRQFLAAGISDAKVVQLKSSGCALVLGPYAADIVERRRKEHNDRHIRGFDTAIVVNDRDFDHWL